MKTVDDVKLELARKIDLFKIVFNSEDGKKVLGALENEFDRDNLLVPGDPHSTHYNLGRRDVVVYIRQMLKAGEKV